MNLLFKKYNEIYKNPKLTIFGKWNVSIVSEKSEYFPLGKEMKNNLILNQALDILTSGKYYSAYSIFNWNTIPAFLMGGAVYGDGNISPLNTDTALTNQTTETNIVNDNSCLSTDNPNNGTRTFRKVYDFATIKSGDTNIKVREMGVYSNWKSPKTLISKFIFPRTVTLGIGQFLRLYYDFTIGSDMIVNPTNINLSSGTFNATGQLKLCGRFDDIFGNFDSNGNPKIVYGDSPRASYMPFCEAFCAETQTCSTKIFGTSYLLLPNMIGFNSINSQIITEWNGQRLEESLGTINPSSYIDGNHYRDIEYIFDYNNPIVSDSFSSILFTVLRGSATSQRENTVDGWLWKFNSDQIKQSSKKIVIMLRQSMARAN